MFMLTILLLFGKMSQSLIKIIVTQKDYIPEVKTML